MPRAKGTQKTGGRKKGSPPKKAVLIEGFRSRLEANDVDIEKALSQAILRNDIDMIKALTGLMPYLTPRIKEAEANAPEDTQREALTSADSLHPKPNLSVLSNAQLLDLLKKPHDA